MTATHTDPTWPEAIAGRIYYAPHPSEKGTFVAIKDGETGYFASTVYTQEHADLLNSRQGISPAEVEAAVICSMFDNWRNFRTIALNLEDYQ